MFNVCFYFFFSSRRRHTRFDCDWSSDVCSSDLRAAFSGSPGTSTGRAASTGGVACSTSITASRSSSNAPSGRNAFGSMARKKWPRRAGSPRPRVLTRIGGKEKRESGGEGKRGEFGGRRVIKKKKEQNKK